MYCVNLSGSCKGVKPPAWIFDISSGTRRRGRYDSSVAKRVREGGVAISIFCAVLIAYWPALNGGFLWDDDRHITTPVLESWHGLWRIWFEVGATQQYYPLLHSAFWLEHRLWGDAVVGYHLTNLAFHALTAWLVVILMRRLALPGAWLAGLLFALHPVCVESVAWISEQKNTLSAVFYVSAALVYLSFDQTRRRSSYWLATLLFAMALLTKTVTATLPAGLLIVIWWRSGRLSLRRDIAPLLGWFAGGASAGLFTAWVERRFIGAEGSLSLMDKCLLAPRIMLFYLAKLVWPFDLTFIYPRWTVDASVWWQYLFPLGLLMLGAGLIVLARKHRGPLAGFLYFAVTLVPVLGFVDVYPFVYSYVADHFQYLASLGIIVPAAAVLARRKWVGGLLLAGLGCLSWSQSKMYVDAETLYRETLARNPSCWLAENNLGALLLDSPGALADAIEHLEASVRLNPGNAQPHNNLGMALSRMPGRLTEAIGQFQTAVEIQPRYLQARNNLGVALSRVPGRMPEAIAQYQAAIAIDPGYLEAHNNLGNAYAAGGRSEEAISEYHTAIKLNPDYAEAHYNLANVLADAHAEDAIAEYQAALRARADYPEADNNLGLVFSRMGRLPDAIREFRVAVHWQPNFAEAHYNLATALSNTPGGAAEAIAEYEAALRIRPDLAAARQMVDRLRAGQR
jgi:tetratricopeptide (TPR) repeat protein